MNYFICFSCCFKKKTLDHDNDTEQFAFQLSNSSHVGNVNIGPQSDLRLSDLSLGSYMTEKKDSINGNNEAL